MPHDHDSSGNNCPEKSIQVNTHLNKGWNLISTAGPVDNVQNDNGCINIDTMHHYVDGMYHSLDQHENMHPLHGVWVYANKNCNLVYHNNILHFSSGMSSMNPNMYAGKIVRDQFIDGDLSGYNFELTTLGDDFDAGENAFEDTAVIMMNCDLIITSDTATAHLAGALGCPTWVALKKVPDWRWMLEQNQSPWYPNMKLYRQKELGGWDHVFEIIKRDLELLKIYEKRIQ